MLKKIFEKMKISNDKQDDNRRQQPSFVSALMNYLQK